MVLFRGLIYVCWQGNENVKALGLQFEDEPVSFTGENFTGLSDLIFLNLDRAKICGNFTKHLTNLMWLDWRGCSTEEQNGELELDLSHLVVLNLSGSLVDQDWEGWNLIMEVLTDFTRYFFLKSALR